MSLRFVIVDDDISICKIIAHIIKKNNLGRVLVECNDGMAAKDIIQDTTPDIALVDLLLPGQDGIELIKQLKNMHSKTSFIMISESDSQSMITQAYQSGIEFFIHKPINVLELVSVVQKVQETRKLKQFMTIVSNTTAKYLAVDGSENRSEPLEVPEKGRVNRIFSDIGIIGEVGVKHLYQATKLIYPYVQADKSYQLNDIYCQLSDQTGNDVKTIEQRIRRTIAKGLHNLANLGLDDFYNDKFQTCSTALFDFKEVHIEMNFISQKSSYHGKINVKKFIEGLLFLAYEN
jgi:two-component system, response regulator YcbB